MKGNWKWRVSVGVVGSEDVGVAEDGGVADAPEDVLDSVAILASFLRTTPESWCDEWEGLFWAAEFTLPGDDNDAAVDDEEENASSVDAFVFDASRSWNRFTASASRKGSIIGRLYSA